jgi:hypothetical protein
VKALCVITPAAIGPQYFRETAEVINAAPDARATGSKGTRSQREVEMIVVRLR